MEKGMLTDILLKQEKRSIKMFLVLFYVTFIGYDILFSSVLPIIINNEKFGFTEQNITDALIYLILFSLLPIAIVLMKRNRPGSIKYMYFIVFTILMIYSDLSFYYNTDKVYSSGNAVEIIIIIFSPIFVNKTFFWLVFLGSIAKYAVIGLVLQAPEVFVPLVLIVGLVFVAYILLNRFQGYVNAISERYTSQFEDVVKGIIATIELKDPYTRGHSERVANYSEIMARELGLYSEEVLQTFYYACLLHDVGKVHISDYVLTKPGSLTEEEYEEVKRHPVVGAEAMKGVEGLQGTVDVIRYHHERWDGTGYPEQLKGLETPLFARITAIADAFDAMTTLRSYRAAMSAEEAYERIIAGKGTQFDPHLVNVFEKVFPKWLKLMQDTKEESIEGR